MKHVTLIQGAAMIATERHEQIHKHGYDVMNDQDYGDNELIKAALFAINPDQFEWPYHWTPEARKKIICKDRLARLAVAGAFIAAEMDRLLNSEGGK